MSLFFKVKPRLTVDGFTTGRGLRAGRQHVVAFWGEEAVSRPYRWRIRTVANTTFVRDNLTESPVGRGAKFEYFIRNKRTAASTTQYVNGVVFGAELRGSLTLDGTHWHVVDYTLRPQLYHLALTRSTQIYMEAGKSIAPSDVARQLLDPATNHRDTQTAAAYHNVEPLYLADTGAGSDEGAPRYVFDIPAGSDLKQQKRPMIVQYDESDLDFFCRLLEREGIYFYFEQKDGCEKLLATNNNSGFHALDVNIYYLHHQHGGAHHGYKGFAYNHAVKYGYACQAVYVRDYNYFAVKKGNGAGGGNGAAGSFRNQDGVVTGDATLGDTDAFKTWGAALHVGQNVVNPMDPTADEESLLHFATVRVEEERAWQNPVEFETTSCLLRPGVEFKLKDERGLMAWNGEKGDAKYLVIASEVAYTWDEAERNGLLRPGERAVHGFTNKVTCIASDPNVRFRPQRLTPVPKIPGVLIARVDFTEDTPDDVSAVDADYNRYTVRLLDEASTTDRLPPAKASLPVREIQNYGGGATLTGTSYPLMKDTEVALAFVGGDPDRPVIVGTLYNEGAKSVTQSGKVGDLEVNRLNRLMTSSGVVFEIYDGD